MQTIDARPARRCPRCEGGRLVRISLLGRRLRCTACGRGFEFDPEASPEAPVTPHGGSYYWTYGVIAATLAIGVVIAAVLLTRPTPVVLDAPRPVPPPVVVPTPPRTLPTVSSQPPTPTPTPIAPMATPGPARPASQPPTSPRKVDPPSPVVKAPPVDTPAPAPAARRPRRPGEVPAAHYMLLPLEGTVGQHIMADVVQKAIDHAARQPGRTLVLQITSNGGLVDETHKITAALQQAQQSGGVRVVAFVHGHAFSAAAIIALACREIYLTPDAVMGAAMPIVTQGGRTSAVGEKMASAQRALARAPAEAAGHDGAIVDAMMDPNVPLVWARRRDGSAAILRGTPADYAAQRGAFVEGPFVLCGRGQILTLTASEAVKVEVADGLAADATALGALLNVTEWRPADTHGRQLAAARAQAIRRIDHEYESLMKDVRRLREAIHRIPQWDHVRVDGHRRTLHEKALRLQALTEEHFWIAERYVRETNQSGDR